MILPIREDRECGKRSKGAGEGDSTWMVPIMMLETRDKGLNWSVRSY